MFVYLILFFSGLVLYHSTFKDNLNWVLTNKLKTLLILFLGFIGENIANLLAALVITSSKIPNALTNDSNIIQVSSKFPPIIILLILGIAGPVVEEIFYRQILVTKLSQTIPSLFAIVVSSLLFASVHVHHITFSELILVTPHFFSGIVLGVIYIKTNNVLFTIILHVFLNITGLIPLFLS
ncbi:CPBP family intramembrane glutamic endopeptidase [Enterococcus sp. S22(2020)]|nr:type II CAAX endopeptidase family protein [Enterococcus sp. S22(2020)]